MTRKRRRRPFPAAALLWTLFGINLLAGCLFSGMTAPVRVRAKGVPEAYREGVEAALKSAAEGRPALQVDASEVRASLLALPGIAKAEFGVNIFGSGLIEMSTTPPVACREDGAALLEDGGFARLGPCPERLPLIAPPDQASGFGVASGWLGEAAARLCLALAQRPDGERRWKVRVDDRGLAFASPEGRPGEVQFGRLADLEAKRDALSRALEANPRLLGRAVEIDLTDPKRPATRGAE